MNYFSRLQTIIVHRRHLLNPAMRMACPLHIIVPSLPSDRRVLLIIVCLTPIVARLCRNPILLVLLLRPLPRPNPRLSPRASTRPYRPTFLLPPLRARLEKRPRLVVRIIPSIHFFKAQQRIQKTTPLFQLHLLLARLWERLVSQRFLPAGFQLRMRRVNASVGNAAFLGVTKKASVSRSGVLGLRVPGPFVTVAARR